MTRSRAPRRSRSCSSASVSPPPLPFAFSGWMKDSLRTSVMYFEERRLKQFLTKWAEVVVKKGSKRNIKRLLIRRYILRFQKKVRRWGGSDDAGGRRGGGA